MIYLADWSFTDEIIYEGGIKDIWLNDSGIVQPYMFQCSKCEADVILNISTDNFEFISTQELINIIIKLELDGKRGLGQYYKIFGCNNCFANYYVGIGLVEPNYGRDVLTLSLIKRINLKKEIE